MAAEYQLRIIDTIGKTQAIITDFLRLAYTRVVNQPGMCSFVLDEHNPAVTYASAFNYQVEVWRRNDAIGLDWTRDFVGIIRATSWATDQSTTLTVTAPGIMSILGWQIVAFRAGISNRSTFNAITADRIMSRIVQYSFVTADSNRIRTALSSGKVSGLYTVTIETAAGTGTIINYSCAYDNVLAALQDVQPISGGDFDLVKTGDATFQYRWYLGQLGTDRTASLYFSLERGNMANPVFTEDRGRERTVSIVAGQGEGTARFATTRTSLDYSASSRAFEMYSNGSSMTTVDSLNALGDQDLYDRDAEISFTFNALQAPNAYYGVHYTLGDLVTATYRGSSYTQKVSSVAIQFDSNGESINVEMTNE